jgi:hypothetical protein
MSSAASSTLHFAHRLNKDGSFDSICKLCARTVMTAKTEPDLWAKEERHDCGDPDEVRTSVVDSCPLPD